MHPPYGAHIWLSSERRRDSMLPCCGDIIPVSVGAQRHSLIRWAQGRP